MTNLLLSRLEGPRAVVHFGGTGSINTYTFAQSLLGFTATTIAVNHVINPGEAIEIVIEADASGSYRAVLRWVRKRDVSGFFSDGATQILWGVVGALIYDQIINSDPKPNITVNTSEVIIVTGGDRVIIPRQVYAAAKNAEKSPDVQRGLARTFAPLEANPGVTDFGLTGSVSDDKPLVQVPRDRFATLTRRTLVSELQSQRSRQHTETARVLILKAWVNHKKRKWTFEWNGVPVSAPIVDEEFLDKIERREYLIGAGDALDVEITVLQNYDAKLKLYVNDQRSYLITRVIEVVPRT
ncbi:MAG TPA: hypothetical protein VNR11_13110 [Xanthobacteraceae bacterium]|nr:hypothetical protein [Xanthobacteraceae bacterium]